MLPGDYHLLVGQDTRIEQQFRSTIIQALGWSIAITLLGCLERHKRWDDAHILAGRMEALLARLGHPERRLPPRVRV